MEVSDEFDRTRLKRARPPLVHLYAHCDILQSQVFHLLAVIPIVVFGPSLLSGSLQTSGRGSTDCSNFPVRNDLRGLTSPLTSVQ